MCKLATYNYEGHIQQSLHLNTVNLGISVKIQMGKKNLQRSHSPNTNLLSTQAKAFESLVTVLQYWRWHIAKSRVKPINTSVYTIEYYHGSTTQTPKASTLKVFTVKELLRKHFWNRLISFKENASILFSVKFMTTMIKMIQDSGHVPMQEEGKLSLETHNETVLNIGCESLSDFLSAYCIIYP